MSKILIRTQKIIFAAVLRFQNEKFTYQAATLAFTTLLALVPLLLVLFYFVTIFPFFKDAVLLGENYIVENFVPASIAPIENYFHDFLQQASSLPILNIIFLFITAAILVDTIEDTLNTIWKTSHTKKHLLMSITYWLIFLLLPLIIGISVFLSSYIAIFLDKSNFLFKLIPILINTIVFSLVYIFAPNVRVDWKDGLQSGLVAAILFECLRLGFAMYLHFFPSYALIYGAFATIPIFLFWLYLFWYIVIFSALVIQEKRVKKHN